MTSRRLAIAVVAALTLAAPARAAVVLDQNLTVPETSYGGVPVYNFGNSGASSAQGAQTFTVGVTGYFDHFDILIGAFGDGSATGTLRLRTVSGGTPDALASLASATVNIPVWTNGFNYHYASFDVAAANVFATAGQVFAISFESQQMSPYGGWAQAGFYAGGNGFSRTGSTSAWTSVNGDLPFRSYISDTPTASANVPEPATIALLGAGLAAFSWRRRRRV